MINTLLVELLSRTIEFLQPNPGTEKNNRNQRSTATVLGRTVGKHEIAIGASVTPECVCPLTADRAKLSVLNTMSRIRGRERPVGYPQTEGMLGDCMLHYGQELGAASEFGTVENGCMLACLMLFLGSCFFLPPPLRCLLVFLLFVPVAHPPPLHWFDQLLVSWSVL